MRKVSDIIEFVEGEVGHSIHRDEGVQHGTADREIERVAVCWQATREALAMSIMWQADLILGHESPYYPYDALIRDDVPENWEGWLVNRRRRDLLERYDLTFLRLHGSLDELCIFDDFAARLGLGDPTEADGLAKVFDIEPRTLGELVEHVKKQMGMDHVRVSAPNGLEQRVSRVGLPWGGLGLFVNVAYQQQLLEMKCDALIAGEACSYGFRFSAECGVPMIETSHEESENPGLARFCSILHQEFPDIEVEFVEVPRPWRWA